MCMHPWFFSMGRWHLGHCLVCAMIQFRFSLSALFLTSHLRTTLHMTCTAPQLRFGCCLGHVRYLAG